ncbi:hypothetical protein [uncultured Victivallis sp.]|uniref:hypothetical protein n=1 Tax=uncultured Victivallis sp. TaxID=354118 RepID=UPI00258752BE|nr:hypothetical protein [uncultured Victivallis sp.]
MLAYRLPYGPHLHNNWKTLEFMCDAGIDLVAISPMNTINSVGMPYSDYPLIWQWFGIYDFETLDLQLQEVLEHHPTARFILTVDLSSPIWLARHESMDSFYELGNCSLNGEWKYHTTNYCRAFLEYCEAHWGNRIEGYVIACGRTLEWLESCNYKPSLLKNSRFPAWLREHGLPELPLPALGPAFPRKHSFLTDPEEEPEYIQWMKFVNSLTADLAIHFLSTARVLIRPEAKLGIFFSHIRDIRAGGHADFERLLDTAPPDFVLGAACNHSPEIGGNSGFMGITHALRRRGISFLFECDRISSTANLQLTKFVTLKDGIWKRWQNAAEDVAGFRRELAMNLIEGNNFWFFNIWGGIYDGKEVRELIRHAVPLWKKFASKSTGSVAEILFVADPESSYFYHDSKLQQRLLYTENALISAGVPYDTATVRDLETIELGQYKLIIFQTFVMVDSARMRLLEEKVCRSGRTVLFLHAAGMIRDGRLAEENVEKLTGFPFGTPGVAERMESGWRICYASEPESLTPEKLRLIAHNSGVHFYCSRGAFRASREFVMIHLREEGEVTIVLPHKVHCVTELFTGKRVAEGCSSFIDRFSSPDTKLYHLEIQEDTK